jgi:hypothetical protein
MLLYPHEKRRARFRCKCLSLKAKAALARVNKYVLTEKKGHFLGPLAGKRGFSANQKTLYFALFHVLMHFRASKLLSASIFQQLKAFKKNRAQNPTIGFLIWTGSGNLAA